MWCSLGQGRRRIRILDVFVYAAGMLRIRVRIREG